MVNIDEQTKVAIEMIATGSKLTQELLIQIMKALLNQLEGNKNAKDFVLENSSKEGKQSIRDLMKKHKDGVVPLEENITKNQLKDYQKELKKMGVDFSVVKTDKDTYSFFFSAEQSAIIEKALKNISEKKEAILNHEDVKESKVILDAEKSNFTEEELQEATEKFEKLKSNFELDEDGKNNLVQTLKEKGIIEDKDIAFDKALVHDDGINTTIKLTNTTDELSEGDLIVKINNTDQLSDISKMELTEEKLNEILLREDVDLEVFYANHLDNRELDNEIILSSDELSDKEKELLIKLNNHEKVEQKVSEEIDSEKELPIEETQKTPITKEDAKELLQEKIEKLSPEKLALFEQRLKYESKATAIKFDPKQAYAEADKLEKMKQNFTQDEIKEINNIDKDVRSPINVYQKNSPTLTANEMLKEIKNHTKEKVKETPKQEKVKTFSMENVKKLDEKVKAEQKDKPVIKNKEQSL